MGARVRSWWQKIRAHPVVTVIIVVASILGIALLVVLVLGYIFNWGWTGLSPYIPPTKDSNFQRGKTLWDWMQLLFIPVVLAAAGFWFNHRERKAAELRADNERKAAEFRAEAEREIEQQRAKAEQEIAAKRYKQDQQIALDKQHEDLLQAYLDRMSELLLKEQLRSSEVDAEARNVARVRTITVLTQLDARRIGYVFAFLRESGLMSTTSNDNVVSLGGADLHAVNWSQADLRGANLFGADLSEASLSGAKLSHAILSQANLSQADLIRANLIGADLSGANLHEADLIRAYLLATNLIRANLIRADLSGADLSGAKLGGADLSFANLSQADLSGADLSGADLSFANLSFANLSQANLKEVKGITAEELEKQAKSLKGATMPDGSIHP
jgi:uncharacterized protein YjbI with pentapeptide repeats